MWSMVSLSVTVGQVARWCALLFVFTVPQVSKTRGLQCRREGNNTNSTTPSMVWDAADESI